MDGPNPDGPVKIYRLKIQAYPTRWVRIVNNAHPSGARPINSIPANRKKHPQINLVKYYLSAFISEYVKTPAEIAKNEINPTKINSIYLTPFVILVFTNSW